MRRSVLLAIAIATAFVIGAAPADAHRAPGPDAAVSELGSAARTAANVAGTTTTVSYVTFIPQSRIDAPVIGSKPACDYGKGYQFGGDGHSAFDWRSPSYRTALHATINWHDKKVVGNRSVEATRVYRKSSGRLVTQKTATSKYMTAKALGWGSRAGSAYVDIRMVTQATNPFCQGILGVKGAINGALTIRLYKNGWWEIRSGSYRRMPNTYIYIYNRGQVSDVVKGKYSSPLCLIGMSGAWDCEEVKLSGFTGEFR
ncbi:hypothetical protein [Marmoricola sp. RAF53]|uniref:hypothetical protein n=1 Tax=Marmoricola sp. RAF53 TaxID=3233059 RepID=UPI003F98876F